MTELAQRGVAYKTVGQLEITFDIHFPSDAKNVPILVWFHGGGLLQGNRVKVAPHMRRSVQKYKHALITADYRLAPQVGVQDVFADVQDCISFIRSPSGLAKSLDSAYAGLVDTSRLAVSGSSAGGYLSLLAGLYVEPKPQVILPIYPITDPLGTFFTTCQVLDPSKKVADATVAPFVDRNAPAMANNALDSDRNRMYSYMLDRANLAELLHFNTGANAQHDEENDKWRVSRQVEARGLPPAYIVHGTADGAVGVEQADEVVGAMVGEGLEVKYERLRGLDHQFDEDESVGLEAMYEFMHKHV